MMQRDEMEHQWPEDAQPAALLATGETDLECDVPEDDPGAEPDSYHTLPDVERPSGRS
jgi:hypothetical protein